MIKAKLLSYWGPGDKRTCESAWTSTYDRDKFEDKTELQIDKVIEIVVGQGHGTPEEATWLEFYVECPIYVERQFDKYRMTQQYQDIQVEYQYAPMGRDNITQNELSGRYRTIPERFIEMPDDVEKIVSHIKTTTAGQIAVIDGTDMWNTWLKHQYDLYQQTLNALKEKLKQNIITQAEYKRAREFLRGMLGTAFITHMKIIMNLRAFEHIMNERLAPDAQVESQELAKLMLKEVIDGQVAPKVMQKMIETNSWKLTT